MEASRGRRVCHAIGADSEERAERGERGRGNDAAPSSTRPDGVPPPLFLPRYCALASVVGLRLRVEVSHEYFRGGLIFPLITASTMASDPRFTGLFGPPKGGGSPRSGWLQRSGGGGGGAKVDFD